MIWQDLVFSFGGFVLAASLYPMLFAPAPPLKSSIPLIVVLSVFAFTMASLELWWGALGMMTQVSIWVGLASKRVLRI